MRCAYGGRLLPWTLSPSILAEDGAPATRSSLGACLPLGRAAREQAPGPLLLTCSPCPCSRAHQVLRVHAQRAATA